MAPNRSKSAFGSAGNKVYWQKLRLTGKFLLISYVLGLYLTGIASGTTSQVCKTWRPTVQSRHSVLWGDKVYYQKLRLTCKFLLDFYILGLYLMEIASGLTSRVYQPFKPGVWFCGEVRSIAKTSSCLLDVYVLKQ